MILFFCKLFLQGSFFLADLFITDRQKRADGKTQSCTDSGAGFLSLDAFALFFLVFFMGCVWEKFIMDFFFASLCIS